MSRRNAPAKAAPRLSHEQAADLLVEYHFGRLSPKMNAAVEAHVKTCRICQRQGLEHAATERREVLRVRVKPTQQFVSRKTRVIFVLLLLAIGFQLAIFGLLRSDSPLVAFLHQKSPEATPTSLASPTPTVATIRKLSAFDSSTTTAAMALSPNGKSLAGGPISGTANTVVLWDTATGKQIATLPWTGTAAPGSLAWSPDGKRLAAVDGSTIGAWDVASHTLLWTFILPTDQAVRVYDASTGSLFSRPDAGAAFAQNTALQWTDNGQLQSVPASALGATGVAASGGADVSLWQAVGFHLFAANGGVSVGFSQSDRDQHRALLTWSPDGHYVLWTNIARAVASSNAASGLTPPNPIITAIVGELSANGQGDAFAWSNADGSQVATCIRAEPDAPLNVYDVASGRVVASLPGVCDHLSNASLIWSSDGAMLFLAASGAPVTPYALPSRSGS